MRTASTCLSEGKVEFYKVRMPPGPEPGGIVLFVVFRSHAEVPLTDGSVLLQNLLATTPAS